MKGLVTRVWSRLEEPGLFGALGTFSSFRPDIMRQDRRQKAEIAKWCTPVASAGEGLKWLTRPGPARPQKTGGNTEMANFESVPFRSQPFRAQRLPTLYVGDVQGISV